MSRRLSAVWWREVRLPLALFAPAVTLFAVSHADVHIARAFFFDPVHARWIGTGSWLAGPFMHTGGRWAIRAIVAAAALLSGVSSFVERLRPMRRPAAYFVVATVLSIALVGVLKSVINVDCPWDLIPFGGHYPVIALFADRPDALRAGHCFPAAHASAGYALMALYFVFREREPLLARMGLAIGVGTGVVFGIAQQSRGAHFLSHDLWSALLVWITVSFVYVYGFRSRLYSSEFTTSTSAAGTQAAPAPC